MRAEVVSGDHWKADYRIHEDVLPSKATSDCLRSVDDANSKLAPQQAEFDERMLVPYTLARHSKHNLYAQSSSCIPNHRSTAHQSEARRLDLKLLDMQ